MPDSCAIVLIVRGDEPLAPRGSTALQADDLLYILCPVQDLDALRACFSPSSDGEPCLTDRLTPG